MSKHNTLQSFIKNIPNNKLLAPIIYNASILDNIKHCDYILSILAENNKVKIYLRKELKNIIINKVKMGKNMRIFLKKYL